MHTFPTKLLTLLLAVLLLGTIACEKEPVSEQTLEKLPQPTSTTTQVTTPVVARFAAPNNPDAQQSNAGGLMIDCIVLNFPFDLLADGITYPISSTDDFDSFLNGPASTSAYIEIAYPVSVTLEDGSTQSVADEASLSMMISDCIPDTGWTTHGFPAFFFDDPACLSLAYPVTLLTIDSVRTTVADASALANLLASNPDIFFFEFPVSTFDADGNPLVINQAQDLLAILTACASPGHGGGQGGGVDPNEFSFLFGGDCFTYNYPITLVSLNSQQSIASDDEFYNALLSGEFEGFGYPISITLVEDGSSVTISSDDDFLNIFNQCGIIPVETGTSLSYAINDLQVDGCLALSYPFEVVVTTSTNIDTLTINNEAEGNALLAAGEDASLVFPLTVVYNGQAQVVNSGLALELLAEECTPGGGGTSGLPATAFIAGGLDPDFDCYDMVFPFSIEEADGTIIVIPGAADAAAYFNNEGEGELVYPVQAILRETGATIDLNGPGDFFTLLENCI